MLGIAVLIGVDKDVFFSVIRADIGANYIIQVKRRVINQFQSLGSAIRESLGRDE